MRAPETRPSRAGPVVARTSSFAYKGKALDVRQIGKELGVSYVLEGSVRKEGDRLRIVAQLVDTRTGDNVWAERFDESGTDPWVLQDEVTGMIVSAMAGEKGAIRKADYRQAWGKDTTNLEEYDYYLRGHDQLITFTPEGTERAGEIWREGLTKFPNSPLLTVKLASYHLARAANFFSDDPPTDWRKTGELVRRVLAEENLSPQVAKLAHWFLAWSLVQEKDFNLALSEAEKAVALAPYDTFMRCDLAIVLVQLGEPDQGLEWAEIAIARDPALGWLCNYAKGWALLALGQHEQAIEALTQTDLIDAPLVLAIAYMRLGRLDDARAAVERMLKANPSVTQAMWRQGYSFRDQASFNAYVDDLAKVGLPEA